MRDYFIHPCQTNLELYEQLKLSTFYDANAILQVHNAYFFALSKVNGLYRGSGKPFICHLVGTCSILAALQCSIAELVAGILHALCQHRVGFEGETSIDIRREIIRNEFGEEVDQLISQYNQFELIDFVDIDVENTNISVVKMRLADMLEDFAGQALFFRGDLNDNHQTKGGFLSHLNFYKAHIDVLVSLSEKIGSAKMANAIKYWLNEVSYTAFSPRMRKGHYTSFYL